MAGVALVAMATAATISSAGAAQADPRDRGKLPSILGTTDKSVIKDSYIVVLKDSKAGAAEVDASAKALTKRFGGAVSRTYSRSIRGFAARMSEAQA